MGAKPRPTKDLVDIGEPKRAAAVATFCKNFPENKNSFLDKNKHDNICTRVCNTYAYFEFILNFTLTLFSKRGRCEQHKSGELYVIILSMQRGPTFLRYVSSRNMFCVF